MQCMPLLTYFISIASISVLPVEISVTGELEPNPADFLWGVEDTPDWQPVKCRPPTGNLKSPIDFGMGEEENIHWHRDMRTSHWIASAEIQTHNSQLWGRQASHYYSALLIF